jgi:hypothetical protein
MPESFRYLFNTFLTKIDNNYSYSNKRIFLFSFLFISVTFILFNLIFCPKYPVNDDIIMMMISSGYFSRVPDEHIVFSSFLIGFVLKFLYINILNINWYTFYLTFSNFLSCLVLMYSFLSVRQNIKTVIAFLLIYVFILKDFCFFLQFSHTATLVSLAGLVLYLSILHRDQKRNSEYVLAAIMIVFGSLIRFEGALLILVLFTPYLIYYISKKKVYKTIIFFGLMIFLVTIFKVANQVYYKLDKEWAYYNDLNLKWGLILNNPKFLAIEKNSTVFTKMGWSLNDQEIFYNYWILEDSSTYSLSKLNFLYNENKVTYAQIEFGRGNFKTWVGNQLWNLHLSYERYITNKQNNWIIKLFREVVNFTNSYYNSFLLILSTYMMIFFISKEMKLYYLLSLILLFLLVLLFNATNNILFKPRILNSMMLSTFCLGVFHNQVNISYKKHLYKLKNSLFGIYILLVISFTLFYLTNTSEYNKKINNNQNQILSQIGNSFPNRIIAFVDGSKGFSTTNFNPFCNEYNLNSSVRIYYSSWLSQSPINKKIFKNLDSKFFFSSLLEGKILLYSEYKDLSIFNPIIIYFREHFNKNIIVEGVNSQNTIYRVRDLNNN